MNNITSFIFNSIQQKTINQYSTKRKMNKIIDGNKNPMVSVIVPIYNTEKYITECIESLLHQTYSPLEIVLVDDGSTDSSGNICDHFAHNNPDIKVIHTTNQGRTRARITGVEKSSGEYVSFVDADDYVSPFYVEHLTKILLEQNVDISCCQCFYTIEKSSFIFSRTEHGRFDRNDIERLLTNNFLYDERSGIASIPLYLCCKLFKKDIIYQALPIGNDLWHGEDIATFFYIIKHSNSIYINEEALYYYRQHDSQTTKRMGKTRWDNDINLFKTLAALDQENYLKEQLPLRILSHLRDWLKDRYLASNTFREFKSDMAYALNNETMEKYFMHKHVATANKRHRTLAFFAQHKLYFLYYFFLKFHLIVIRIKEKQGK